MPRLNPEQAPRILGAIAFTAVLLTIASPGLTIDEPLDVRPGRTYIETLASQGLGFFRPEVVDRVFRDNAEHPPLGRWLLGMASKLGETVEVMLSGGPDPLGIYVRSGRLAPAACFGLLVFLIAREAKRRHGVVASWAAGFALIAMPRVFSHAHLGALDLFITLFWTWSFLSVDRALDSDRPVQPLTRAGLVFGLALLTKIHAWLLPPLLFIRWAVFDRRRSSLLGLVLWGLIGLTLLFVAWPWLWYDPVGRLARYLGTGVTRTTIRVLYFGTVYDDTSVPWHYPWFYFAATVPVGLHLLGLWGTWLAWRGRRQENADLRSLAAIVYLLAIFSTSVAVYDGERLYLMVFPLWALVVGRGFADLWERWALGGKRRKALVLGLAFQFVGLASVFPYGLSYYNLAVGGLPGAERLGLELVYWSEAVDDRLLLELGTRAETKATAALIPTLAPDQGKYSTTRFLLSKSIVLADQEAAGTAEWWVVYRRTAYLSAETQRAIQDGEMVYVQSRQGVWLAGLLRRTKTNSPH